MDNSTVPAMENVLFFLCLYLLACHVEHQGTAIFQELGSRYRLTSERHV